MIAAGTHMLALLEELLIHLIVSFDLSRAHWGLAGSQQGRGMGASTQKNHT